MIAVCIFRTRLYEPDNAKVNEEFKKCAPIHKSSLFSSNFDDSLLDDTALYSA